MKVFVSYACADKIEVATIVNELASSGFDVWWDQSLTPASLWEDALIGQLTECDVLCVCLSPSSVCSEWVEKEYTIALEKMASSDKPKVIPVMLKTCEIPAALKPIQFIDMTDFPDSLWGLIGLMKAVDGKQALLDNKVTIDRAGSNEAMLPMLPPWQRALEQLFNEDKYVSRSLVSLSYWTGLSALEITHYCLSCEHLSISPYQTPAAQPIPYFGRTERLFRRYQNDEAQYLTHVKNYFNQQRQKKKHREYQKCWDLIEAHYEQRMKALGIKETILHQVTDLLSEQQDMIVVIQAQPTGQLHQQGHQLMAQVIESSPYTPLILTQEECHQLPSFTLRSILLNAPMLLVDRHIGAGLLNYIKGLYECSTCSFQLLRFLRWPKSKIEKLWGTPLKLGYQIDSLEQLSGQVDKWLMTMQNLEAESLS